MKIASIVGARPQFVKLAPLAQAVEERNRARGSKKIEHVIIHTGQHYDYQMNKVFFDELGIPEPRYNLNVGSETHGRQTGEMMKQIESVLVQERPSWTFVYGDTNSTLAGAIAAAKLGRPLAHVEAGLRSYRRDMPEEINRVLTDHCADLLFCPTITAVRNLRKEGFANILNNGELISRSSLTRVVPSASFPVVVNVGDIMIDALRLTSATAEKNSRIMEKMGLRPKSYFLATLHRAENTDQPETLKSLMTTFAEIHTAEKPLIFCLHPRTRKALKKNRLFTNVARSVILIDPPPSYFDILILEKYAAKILTDSGGIQKEAYFFNVPCITLRNETEWVETTKHGRNIIAGTNRERILKAVNEKPAGKAMSPELFYGRGIARTLILDVLSRFRPTPL
jgi:UDP-N-acetylglucosamine 2-epimerase